MSRKVTLQFPDKEYKFTVETLKGTTGQDSDNFFVRAASSASNEGLLHVIEIEQPSKYADPIFDYLMTGSLRIPAGLDADGVYEAADFYGVKLPERGPDQELTGVCRERNWTLSLSAQAICKYGVPTDKCKVTCALVGPDCDDDSTCAHRRAFKRFMAAYRDAVTGESIATTKVIIEIVTRFKFVNTRYGSVLQEWLLTVA